MKIHPALFESIFNPKGNTLQTTKYTFTSFDSNDLSNIGRQFEFDDKILTTCREQAFSDQSSRLKIESSCATLECSSFLYRGAIKNGCRHDSMALMLAVSPTLEIPSATNINYKLNNSKSGYIAKIWSPFVNGIMHGDNAIIEWYAFENGSTSWEDITQIWRNSLRNFSDQSHAELNLLINNCLSSFKLKAIYKGSIFKGLKHGFGTMKWIESGDKYKGQFLFGKRHGKGIMEWPTRAERFEGEWIDGLPHGFGSLQFFNIEAGTCNYFEGQFKNGKKDGRGTFYYADGTKFEGEWQNDLKNGNGSLHFMNGVVERGYYENDRKVRDLDANDSNSNEDTKSSKSKRPFSRGSAAGSTFGQSLKSPSVKGQSLRPSSTKSISSSNTQKRGPSRKSALLKNRRVAKELQSVNNQQFNSIPFFIDDILMVADYNISDIEALSSILTRFAPKLQEIYNFYCIFGEKVEIVRVSQDKMFKSDSPKVDEIGILKTQTIFSKHNDLSLYQFWRFSRECILPTLNNFSIAFFDRIFTKTSQIASRPDIRNAFDDESPKHTVLINASRNINLHSPHNRIRFREFCEIVFRISVAAYNSFDKKNYIPFHVRLEKLLEDIIFPSFEQIKQNKQINGTKDESSIFLQENEDFQPLIQEYLENIKQIFQNYATLQSFDIQDNSLYSENDATITIRQLIRMLELRHFIDEEQLTTQDVLNIFSQTNEQSNETNLLLLDKELIFEEFIETILKVGFKRLSIYSKLSQIETIQQIFHLLIDGQLSITEQSSNEDLNVQNDQEIIEST